MVDPKKIRSGPLAGSGPPAGAGEALGIEEVEQLLEALLVDEVAQEPSLATLPDQPIPKQDVQVVGQGGRRHSNLLLDLTDDHPVRMRLPEPAQDPQPDLMRESLKAAGVPAKVVHHGSIIPEP
jgi:hypothetical protein